MSWSTNWLGHQNIISQITRIFLKTHIRFIAGEIHHLKLNQRLFSDFEGIQVKPHLIVIPPLRLVLWAHLANQLLHFGSPQWILGCHRAGIAGSEHLLCRVVVCDLVGAVGPSSWRRFIIQAWWTVWRESRVNRRKKPNNDTVLLRNTHC